MKNRKLIPVIALSLVLAVLLSACGGSAKFDMAASTEMAYPTTPTAAPAAVAGNGWSDSYAKAEEAYEMPMEMPAPDADYTAAESMTGSSSLPQNVKLIYTAYINVQTVDFQQTYNSVVELVKANGGYFESSDIQNGGYYSDGSYMYGYYTIRIPSENYSAFVNAVGSSCHVTNLNESVEDIGLEYFEVEQRLETLYTKEERLHELLAKAEDLSDIIDLENALSDTEYEIDMYTSRLNRYDSLVGYSTVTLNIEQVRRVEQTVQQDMSFGARVRRSFSNGVASFVAGCENFVVWLSGNIFDILLVLIIIVILLIVRPIRRIFRGGRERSERRSEKKAAKKARKNAGGKQTANDTVVIPQPKPENTQGESEGWTEIK